LLTTRGQKVLSLLRMKSKHDPRHKRRRAAIKELFASSFVDQSKDELAQKVTDAIEELDHEITISAPQWPIDKLNRIDLAILQLATYEILHTDTPPKVVIDEAVELAKEYGGESTPSFVNGVLGDILKRYEERTKDKDN